MLDLAFVVTILLTMKMLRNSLILSAVLMLAGISTSNISLADHEPVVPFQLFIEPPEAHELPEGERDILDDPVPVVPPRSPVIIAEEEQERERIEEFKRQHFEAARKLPPLSSNREERLRELFEILQETPYQGLARLAEAEVQRVWSKSGSDTIDLMFGWANDAMERKEFAKALDFLDNIIALEPTFMEAWNRRATLHYLREDFARSIADVEKVLSLEPRHFGALSGLGIMMRELGRDEQALAAFEQALDLNPNLKRIRDAAKDLKKKVQGRES